MKKQAVSKPAARKKAAAKKIVTPRPKRPVSMRHITRVDYDKKHQHGWWVRIQRDGRMIQQFFSDVRYSTRTAALRHAKVYRDDLLIKHPKPEHGNNFNRPNSRNRSGVAGVHLTNIRKDGIPYPVWQTAWMLPDGTRVVRKFGFSPRTRTSDEAKALAVAAREKGLKEIAKLRRQIRKAEKQNG